MTASPRLGFTYLTSGQATPETGVNEIAAYLESGSGHFIFKDRDLSTPPGSPANGDCYLVAATGSGAWTGHTGDIAYYLNTAWVFVEVIEGYTAWVNDENVFIGYDGAAWNILAVASAGTFLQSANNLSDVGSVATSRTSLGLGTADSPQFAAVNIGHASDTTITRTGAGDIAVEGNGVYRAGGTDVPLTDGGTGASSASGARTNLGATTVGANIFTLTNPSAITFLRMNADNTVDALSAAAFRTAIGAGTGSGSGDMLAANNLSDVASVTTSRTNLGVGTGDSPQFTGVNIGHASDTTVTRTGAGDIAVEGNAIYRAGGTDVPLTDGGTGASTAAAARANLQVGQSVLAIACSDETTALTTGTNKAKFINPYDTAFNVTAVVASLSTAQTSGSIFTVDINEAGTTILSTKLTIDNTETKGGSVVAAGSATPAVISDASIAAYAEIEVDIDQVGDGTAKGLKVYLIGYPS